MKTSSYILSIKEPCGQDWQSMELTEQGRFCSHCSKTVIDFTALSDNDIIKVIEQAAGAMCGSFHRHQLNRTLIAPQHLKKTNKLAHWYKILAGLVLLGTSSNSTATIKDHTVIVSNPDSTHSDIANPNTESPKTVLQGRIKNDNRKPVMGANITVKGIGKGTVSVKNGTFKLTVPGNMLTDSFTLIISHPNYYTREIQVSVKDIPLIFDIVLEEIRMRMMGYFRIEEY